MASTTHRAINIIEKELGLAKITDKFEKFSEEPLAAASLGQVSELLEAVRLFLYHFLSLQFAATFTFRSRWK